MRKTPVHVAWQTTSSCNLNCIHCYANAGPTTRTANLLSTREAMKVLRDIADLGAESIVFTGGEPLMRSDILYLVGYASDLNLKPILVTNGTLLDTDTIKQLRSVNATVTINLPTVNEEIHEKFTGVKSSLGRKLRSIESCLKYGLKCSIGVALTNMNISYVEEVLEYAKERGLYCDLLCVVPMGRATVNMIPKGKYYISFLLNILKTWKAIPMNAITSDVNTFVSVYEPIYPALMKMEGLEVSNRLCSIGDTIHVMENGYVRTCVFLPVVVGNVRKRRLTEIWEKLVKNDFIMKLKNPRNLKGKCRDCIFNEICGGCRARTYLITGDYFESDPVCYLTREG